MNNRQEIVLVKGECYTEIKCKIQDEINTRRQTKYVQQIDYFGMSDDDNTGIGVFILFTPKDENEY